MAVGPLGLIHGQREMKASEGIWQFDEDDWLLIAMLQDPIFCAELLFDDPKNHTHGGCYVVMDYQFVLFRPTDNYETFPCARSVGKTESLKARSVTHAFRRVGEDLLLTAPELIHLSPLTQAVESRIISTRLTRDFLKKENQRTGIVKTPAFQVDFMDNTRIMGRIPRSTGQGVKGMHEPDMMMDECFPAGSLILTARGLVPIEEVKKGDQVLTHNNRWRPVIATMKRKRETVTLYGHGHPGIRCSLNHKFWSVTSRRGTVEADGHRGRLFSDPIFTPAIDMAPESGYPSDNEARLGARYWATPTEVPWLPIPDMAGGEWECDAFWWLLGVYLAEGCISTRAKPQLTFAIHRDEVAELTEALDDVGIDSNTYLDSDSLGARVQIRGSHDFVAFVLDNFGRIGSEKQMPSWVYGMGDRERRLILDGYIWGDGNPHSDGRYSPGRWQASCAEKALTLSVKILAQTLGYSVTLYWTAPRVAEIRGRPVQSKGWYQIIGSTRSRTYGAHGQRFSLVRRTERTNETETLYDLTVADDHSFVVEGITVSNSQDYPERGFTEIHETVMKDHVDSTGEPDFTYHLYGVHTAAQGSRFAALASSGDFRVTAVTAIMRPGWNRKEKAAAAAMYGGTSSPDYRRNILGEPGTGSSQFFVTARLIACLDQDEESKYNTQEYHAQELQIEEVDKLIPEDGDIGSILDLPDNLGQEVFCGMDVGLVNDPTVIMIFAVLPDAQKKKRLKLVRMFHLWRFREGQIRKVTYTIGRKYGKTLRAFGQDITGLGLPLYQAMGDDNECPEHLKEVSRGYVFNAKMPVAVSPEFVSKQGGEMVDQYGNMVEERRNDWTGQTELVTKMTMIEASTRYLRQFVDNGFLWLPFAPLLVKDMQGETEQRVKAMGAAHLRKKPNAFHMLDAMRAMAMAYMAGHTEEMIYQHAPGAVLDQAMDLTGNGGANPGGYELQLGGV